MTSIQGVFAAAYLSQICWSWAAAVCDRQTRCSICDQSPFSMFRKSIADSSQNLILWLLSVVERDSTHDLIEKWEYLKVRITPVYTSPISHQTLAPATLGHQHFQTKILYVTRCQEIFIIATGQQPSNCFVVFAISSIPAD